MSNENKKPWAKVLSIICTVLTAIVLVLTAIIVVNIVICSAQKKPVSFFGTSFAIVQTNSMEPEIKVGDLIIYHSCKYADVEVGDYIVFVAGDGFDTAIRGQSVVHEAIAISGSGGITTKGVNNPAADKAPVTADNLLGKCTFNSAGWGAFFRFLSKNGIIIIIAIIAIPFIVSQILKIVKLSKQHEEEKRAGTAIPPIEENAQLPPSDGEASDDVHDDEQ
ncbi:MAG: signal peptidase I [Clostridia bacterium]|nr:signal peptidase I [Clostridia bacterium]